MVLNHHSTISKITSASTRHSWKASPMLSMHAWNSMTATWTSKTASQDNNILKGIPTTQISQLQLLTTPLAHKDVAKEEVGAEAEVDHMMTQGPHYPQSPCNITVDRMFLSAISAARKDITRKTAFITRR